MPIPTSYTEDGLADYLIAIGGEIVTDTLGWTIDNLAEVVNDTLLAYGESDISLITTAANIRFLRLLARKELWKAIMQATAHEHSFGAAIPGGVSTNRNQIHEHAKQMLTYALIELAAEYGVSDVTRNVTTATISYDDPYDDDSLDVNQWSRVQGA